MKTGDTTVKSQKQGVCVGNGRQTPASTCISSGEEFECYTTTMQQKEEPGRIQELIKLTTLLISVAGSSLMSPMEEDVQGSSAGPQTRVPPDWEQAFDTRDGGVRSRSAGWGGSRGSKGAAGWMTSVTPCFRFPWRQE